MTMTWRHARPLDVDGICYGGDYNPEQWPREVWDEDVRLMREAGVNLVSIAVFSWARLEPREGELDAEWLDDLVELLHSNGIRVSLGTPTASPPAWFFRAYPHARVVTREGVTLGFGSRGMAAPTSPEYRQAALRITTALADRYGDHPAVALWHVHNEYGAPVAEDYSDNARRAWRPWLRERYGSLDALNDAWGTAFWGQTYHEWEEIDLPAAAPSVVNPAQRLDFARFSDAMLLECFVAERDAIRTRSRAPVTTNFMATECDSTDLWRWAREVDMVSNDHYLTASDPRAHIGLAMAADLTRSVAGGKPWLLLEHSTSAVNWQERNVAKRPGEMARNAMSHLARGADAIMFFQWRASRSGAEKFHSAMLPHAGTTSRTWREVTELGAELARLAPVRGSVTRADVAVLWDTESLWAQGLEWRPSVDLVAKERIAAYYERLWRDGLTVDFALPSHDLARYPLVVAPASYLLTAEDAANLTRYVEAGGTLLVSCFSGIVDAHDAVHPGGFMAPLRGPLGVWVEEFLPLHEHETVRIEGLAREVEAGIWAEDLQLDGADVVARYVDGPAPGAPAVTRHAYGSGQGWYVSTALDADALAPLLERVYADANLALPELPHELEVVRREDGEATFTVYVNHAAAPATTPQPPVGTTDLLTEQPVDGPVMVPGGGVRVLRTPR